MKLFITGVGYTAGRLIATQGTAFSHISGTVRNAEKRDAAWRARYRSVRSRRSLACDAGEGATPMSC